MRSEALAGPEPLMEVRRAQTRSWGITSCDVDALYCLKEKSYRVVKKSFCSPKEILFFIPKILPLEILFEHPVFIIGVEFAICVHEKDTNVLQEFLRFVPFGALETSKVIGVTYCRWGGIVFLIESLYQIPNLAISITKLNLF